MKLNDMAVRKAEPEAKPYQIADGRRQVLCERWDIFSKAGYFYERKGT
jgi:hypothetical protein